MSSFFSPPSTCTSSSFAFCADFIGMYITSARTTTSTPTWIGTTVNLFLGMMCKPSSDLLLLAALACPPLPLLVFKEFKSFVISALECCGIGVKRDLRDAAPPAVVAGWGFLLRGKRINVPFFYSFFEEFEKFHFWELFFVFFCFYEKTFRPGENFFERKSSRKSAPLYLVRMRMCVCLPSFRSPRGSTFRISIRHLRPGLSRRQRKKKFSMVNEFPIGRIYEIWAAQKFPPAGENFAAWKCLFPSVLR